MMQWRFGLETGRGWRNGKRASTAEEVEIPTIEPRRNGRAQPEGNEDAELRQNGDAELHREEGAEVHPEPGAETRPRRRRGKRTSGRDRGSVGAAVTDILDAYDRKFDDASRQLESLEEARTGFREGADALIADVIEPTLAAIGEEAISRGHHWRVETRVDIQSEPAVACLFRPKSTRSGPASELTFRCRFPDRLSATAIIHRGGKTLEPAGRSHLTDDVDAELVQDEVARFIGEALEGEALEDETA